MKTILRLLPLSLALCLCGCGPDYQFSPWAGPQSNWTTGPGGYVRMVGNVPLYGRGQYPSRPYIILGSVTTDSEDNLADAAHDQHADAILLTSESVHRSGSVVWPVPGGYGETPITSRRVTADLIKYR